MKKLSFTLLLLVASLFAIAQPQPPNSDNPAPLHGLVILATAGFLVGMHKHYKERDR